MIDIGSILGKYKLVTLVPDGNDKEMIIKPAQEAHGIEVLLFGQFGDLKQATVTGVSVDGLVFDVASDSELDEAYFARLLESFLGGNYEYKIEKRNLKDKLVNGAVYLSVNNHDKLLLDNYRCKSQKRMKALYNAGKLQPVAYSRNGNS